MTCFLQNTPRGDKSVKSSPNVGFS